MLFYVLCLHQYYDVLIILSFFVVHKYTLCNIYNVLLRSVSLHSLFIFLFSLILILLVVAVVVQVTFHCCLLNCNVILFDFLITVRVLIKVFVHFVPSFFMELSFFFSFFSKKNLELFLKNEIQ